ncbi:MAG: BspA family leucine-rich repeat surface protein [Bacteroides sp.]
MKQILRVVTVAVLLSFGSVASTFAQGGAGRPFITKWQGKAGEALKFPIVGTEYKLVIKDAQGKVVKTEEKVTVTGEGEAYYHAFTPTADGVYTVEAGPEGVKYMRMKAEWKNRGWILLTSNAQLLEVVQFGTVAWESMGEMFLLCEEMTFAPDIDTPDLTKVTEMKKMFDGCRAFNQPLEKWDVSKVTNMLYMFFGCRAFNQPLGKWDVSKVTDMSGMFYGCSAFNQPLEKWDVSKVTYMEVMFDSCKSFNQPLNNWNVSQVTDMVGMFDGCTAFNQPLEKWEVSKVTNMHEMFKGCSAFNQPLEKWDVSKVTNMGRMFDGCSAFNQPLEKWNVSKVTYMGWMFDGCKSFNQPLGKWKIKTAVGGLGSTAMSPSNYSTTLVGWAAQSEIAENVHFGNDVRGLIYNNEGKAARAKLIGKGWTFEGDVYKPSEKVAITLAQEGEGTLAIEGYNDAALQAVAEGTELTVIATPKDGYTLTSLTAGTQDILATKKFTVTGAVEVKAVFEKKQAVEDAVLASLSVAPNPFAAQLRILNPEGLVARYELVNATGVVVRSGVLSATEEILDTEALPSGVYFVRLEAQGGVKKTVMVSK